MEQTASQTVTALPPVVGIVGVGDGNVVEEIWLRSPSTRILVVEPDETSVRPLLSSPNFRKAIDARRLVVVHGPDYRDLPSASRAIGEVGEIKVFVGKRASRENPDGVAAARAAAERVLVAAQENARARRRFAGGYVCNTLTNAHAIARSADVVSLFGQFAGVPAIVVAAGPSLDEAVADLKALRSSALIIAVDTALQPLLECGVRPHFAVAVDPGEGNAAKLTTERVVAAGGETCLVAEPSVSPSVFDVFGDRVFTFKVSDHQPWPWLRDLGLDRAVLSVWGSVLTSAFDLAVRAGCDPIVFAGADLAYTNGRPYCRGTIYDDEWATTIAAGDEIEDAWRWKLESVRTVEATDMNGAATPATDVLVAFRDWLVERVQAVPDRRVVNSTPAGILFGNGIEREALSEIRASLPDAPLNISGRIAEILSDARSQSKTAETRLRDAIRRKDDRNRVMDKWRDTWLDFAAGSIAADDLEGALTSATTRQPDVPLCRRAGRPQAVLEGDVADLRAPECAAIVRNALMRRWLPGWAIKACRPVIIDGCAVSCLSDALLRTLRLVTSRQALVTGRTRLASAHKTPETIPALYAFEWTEAARAEVVQTERLMAAAIVIASSGRHYASLLSGLEELVNLCSEISLPPSISGTEMDARHALMREWTLVVGMACERCEQPYVE